MKEVSCDCKDYKEGTEQVIGAQRLLLITKGIEYTGKKIRFCPWCGRKLEGVGDADKAICDALMYLRIALLVFPDTPAKFEKMDLNVRKAFRVLVHYRTNQTCPRIDDPG